MTSCVCNEWEPLARSVRVMDKGRFTITTVVVVIYYIIEAQSPDLSKGFLGNRGKPSHPLNQKVWQHTIFTEYNSP